MSLIDGIPSGGGGFKMCEFWSALQRKHHESVKNGLTHKNSLKDAWIIGKYREIQRNFG